MRHRNSASLQESMWAAVFGASMSIIRPLAAPCHESAWAPPALPNWLAQPQKKTMYAWYFAGRIWVRSIDMRQPST